MKDSSEMPVVVDVSEAIATVTMNNPRAMNVLSEDMLAALQETWDQIATDRSIKVVILRGAGDHFCAGHNLKEMTARRADPDGGKAYFNALFETCTKMMLSIVRLPQPVIAEVQGIATAAGCQLVATCDLAIAADDARFATSGVNIGLFCSTPMVALSRNVTRKQAMEMLLLGDFLPAKRVLDMGLINQAVPKAGLSQATRDMARKIADKAPVAIKIGKEAFYAQAEMTLENAYAYAGAAMAENMMARDTTQGIDAFINKQPMPPWEGE